MDRVSGWRSGRSAGGRVAPHDDPKALATETPPKYERGPTAPKLDALGTGLRGGGFRRSKLSGCGSSRPTCAMRLARRSSMTLCARSGRAVWSGGRFQRTVYRPGNWCSAISGGRAGWCSAICGGRASWSRSGTGRHGAAGSRRQSCAGPRLIAGTLVFCAEAPDIPWGLAHCLSRVGGVAGEAGLGSRERRSLRRAAEGRVRGILRAAWSGLGWAAWSGLGWAAWSGLGWAAWSGLGDPRPL
jgi:hypothetical protein